MKGFSFWITSKGIAIEALRRWQSFLFNTAGVEIALGNGPQM
jgi:hypothetical protein